MLSCKQTSGYITEKLLHQVADLFELNIKLPCQKVNSGAKGLTDFVFLFIFLRTADLVLSMKGSILARCDCFCVS
jgi:hypothetical protein